MNTLIIAEAELIIKDDATAQLRISTVLLRKACRWDVPYAPIKLVAIKLLDHPGSTFSVLFTFNIL